MFVRLSKLNSEFAQKLVFEVKCQIIDRRQTIVSTSLAYLEDPAFLHSVADRQLAYSDREEIAKKIADLHVRLFPTTSCTESQDEEDPDEVQQIYPDEGEGLSQIESATTRNDGEPPPKRNRSDSSSSEDLDDYLEKKPPLHVETTTDPLDVIKNAMAEFESSGERPATLQKVYNALLSVPATSCEAER